MKKVLPLLVAGLLAGAPGYAQNTTAPVAKALDEKYGFRDLRFEMDTTAVANLKITERKGSRAVGTRTTENMKIGKATINSISYTFFKGKLAEVTLVTKGLTNSHALMDALETQYGQSTAPGAASRNRFWEGKQVKMTYAENAFYDGTVRIYVKQLADEMKQDTQSIKKNTSDL